MNEVSEVYVVVMRSNSVLAAMTQWFTAMSPLRTRRASNELEALHHSAPVIMRCGVDCYGAGCLE